MAVFAYVAKDSEGKIRLGSIKAPNEKILIKKLTEQGFMVQSIMAENGIGMQTMDQALRDLVLQGMVTYEDAMSRAHNPAELEVMISGGQQMQAAAQQGRR